MVGGGVGRGGVGGGDDDDIGNTDTPNTISTRAVLLGIYSTFAMVDPLI